MYFNNNRLIPVNVASKFATGRLDFCSVSFPTQKQKAIQHGLFAGSLAGSLGD